MFHIREEVKCSYTCGINNQIPEVLVLPTDNLFQMTLLGKSLTLEGTWIQLTNTKKHLTYNNETDKLHSAFAPHFSALMCTICSIPSALVLRITCCVPQKRTLLFLHTMLLYALVWLLWCCLTCPHRIAKDPRFERLPCMHKGTYADDCLVQRVTQVFLFLKFSVCVMGEIPEPS